MDTKKRILIVDDSSLVHKIYGEQLESADFEVLHAEDGISAINTTFSEMPDLILLDIHMPKINGYQVCRLLKDHPVTKMIPIIIVTAEETSDGLVVNPRKWSFQTGADGYVSKEIEKDIVELIKPFLSEGEQSRQSLKPYKAMTEMEILTALSNLLDKQLYQDVTRLKELDERKNAFVANVSHEFKSPLTVIKGTHGMFLKGFYGPITDEQRHVLEIANNTINRLNRLVMNLLDLAKIESGKMTLDKTSIRIVDLVQEVIETYSLLIEEKKMKVQTDIPVDFPTIEADKDRLTQAIINIFNNSLKFTPDGGQITFRAIQEDNVIRLEIEDNGPGMSQEGLRKIFDKFERITAEKREGTGLGLSIAKDMVLLHGGKIWAESEEKKGSKFVVVLPIQPY